MFAEIFALMWKEWRQLLQRAGGNLAVFIVRMCLFFAVFALITPVTIEDSQIAGDYWGQIWITVPAIIVLGLIPFTFAGERETRTLPTLLASPLSDRALVLGKMGVPIIYALICALIISICLLVKVSIFNNNGSLILYSPESFISGIVTCFLVAILMATLGIYNSMRAATVRQAQTNMLLSVLLFFFLPGIVFGILIIAIGIAIPTDLRENLVTFSQGLNSAVTTAIILLGFAVLDLVLILLLLKWFKRDTLLTVN